jgi:hypothetical protein
MPGIRDVTRHGVEIKFLECLVCAQVYKRRCRTDQKGAFIEHRYGKKVDLAQYFSEKHINNEYIDIEIVKMHAEREQTVQ